MVVEFECKAEEQPAFDPWLKELEGKLDKMKEFKKTFQKYHLGLETSLKKVGVFDKNMRMHMQNSRAKYGSFATYVTKMQESNF